MNKKRKNLLLWSAMILIIMCLYPPQNLKYSGWNSDQEDKVKWGPITWQWQDIVRTYNREYSVYNIDIDTFFIQYISLMTLTSFGYLLLGDSKVKEEGEMIP